MSLFNSRWKSNEDFDWSGLEASIRPAHSTTTTTTIAPSFASSRSVLSAPDPPTLSTIPKHQISMNFKIDSQLFKNTQFYK